MDDNSRKDKTFITAEMRSGIQLSFLKLEELLESLNSASENQPTDQREIIREHLVHLAAWDLAAAGFLEHGCFDLLGNKDIFAAEWSQIDRVNEQIDAAYHHLSFAEARMMLEGAHSKLIQALDALENDDLQRIHVVQLPGSVRREIPVWQILLWTTSEHFLEHAQTIQEMQNNSV